MKKVIKVTSKYLQNLGYEDTPELLDQSVNRVSTEADIIAEESGKIFGRISSLSVDSDGDLIIPKGINFDRYLKNPVVLFNHSLDAPIGRCETIAVENDGVYANFRLASIEDAQEVYTLLKEKVLNTLSIGFIITEYVSKGSAQFNQIISEYTQRYKLDLTGCKRVITKCNLMEFSIVTIPSNENAIIIDVKKIKEQLKDIEEKAIEVPIKEESKLQYKKIPRLEYKKIDNTDKIEYLRKWGL